MARFLTYDEDQSRQLLASAGVTLATVGPDGDAPVDLVSAVLPEGSWQVRAEVDIDVPQDSHAGMGAWHVNAVDEVHVVRTGEGIMEFVTIEGPVAVVVGAGDVVAIRGAEHRYLPLSAQRWVIRHGGGPDAQLGAVDTGRSGDPWPDA